MPRWPESTTDRALDRFFRFVVFDPSGCWLWTGARDKDGYALFKFQGRMRRAQRWVWQFLNGPIPEGLHTDHLCRTHPCVCPDHIEPVTPLENVMRGLGPAAINSRKTHCVHGHPFDEENTYRENGRRRCRVCLRERSRKWQQQHPEYGRQYRLAHMGQYREYQRAFRLRSPIISFDL